MIRSTPLPFVIVAASLLGVAELRAQGSAVHQGAQPDAGAVGSMLTPAPSGPATNRLAEADATRVVSVSRAESSAAFGLSGALRAAVLRSSHPVPQPLVTAAGTRPEAAKWVPVVGTVRQGLLGEPVVQQGVVAPDGPGVWHLHEDEEEHADADQGLSFITTVSFAEKRNGYLNGYHIGVYPTEASGRTDGYAPPEAFIEVTPENQDLQISEHFTLREFLTKDQFDVWPKYLVLNLRLIDKLELVLQELNRMGVRAIDVHVMSGFRTPQYNGPGGDGRAALSRHMYGDAADIWVDGDRDGYIDDLNGDGKHDIADAEVLLRAVERVEQRHPELTGGAGLYEANGYHGPFVHVDVRGNRARW